MQFFVVFGQQEIFVGLATREWPDIQGVMTLKTLFDLETLALFTTCNSKATMIDFVFRKAQNQRKRETTTYFIVKQDIEERKKQFIQT